MDLVFQQSPDVVIATNTFRNVPTILQYEETPLIEVGKFAEAGYTTRFSIFHNDGTKIAVVDGSRIRLTPEGDKANIRRREEQNLVVCELDGKPIIEMRHTSPHSLRGWAELHAPGGVFIKALDAGVTGIRQDGSAITLGGMTMTGCTFINNRIGIHVRHDGIHLGVA